MSQHETAAVNIVLGLKCTMACSHCCNASSPAQAATVSDTYIRFITGEINQIRPRDIIFTGGEPTLYIEHCNRIIRALEYTPNVVITTNGHFASNTASTYETLSQLVRISTLQLSFDRFHKSTLHDSAPRFLKEYCETHNIAFAIIACLSSPMDLVFANTIQKKYRCPVSFQKIDGSGRARVTGCEFAYPIFDRTVLQQRCPNAGTLSFLQEQGISHCCANVVYNIGFEDHAFATTESLWESRFYRETVVMTFGERMRRHGISAEDLPPRLSSPCNLCEHIETMVNKNHAK